MERRTFFQRNYAIILSLPGAAPCSLPLSQLGWYILGIEIPAFVTQFWPGFSRHATWVLASLGFVCSTIAMLRFISGRGNVSYVTHVVLAVFNLITMSASMAC